MKIAEQNCGNERCDRRGVHSITFVENLQNMNLKYEIAAKQSYDAACYSKWAYTRVSEKGYSEKRC